ncbi:MAG: CARDB domain-containing protein, partial [Patescibacteria group bacterium]
MDTNTANTSTRQAAIYGLAVVGFITLVTLGVSLAVYSARYVPTVVSYLDTTIPTVVSRIGTAAVSLSQIFTPAPKPSLSVVSTASTTIWFGTAPSTVARATSTPAISIPKKPLSAALTTAGGKTNETYQISGTSGATALSGLPDLVMNITAVGYFTSTSTDSFVASSTVPSGYRPAVKFTIKNVGTNAASPWRFSASIPTSSNFIYQSIPQQSLNPGDYIEYTLGFDQAIAGTDKMISVTANFDHAVAESNTNNNSA